ncbi:unnamed protein product, partial [Phaeothamnion confervicola]
RSVVSPTFAIRRSECFAYLSGHGVSCSTQWRIDQIASRNVFWRGSSSFPLSRTERATYLFKPLPRNHTRRRRRCCPFVHLRTGVLRLRTARAGHRAGGAGCRGAKVGQNAMKRGLQSDGRGLLNRCNFNAHSRRARHHNQRKLDNCHQAGDF